MNTTNLGRGAIAVALIVSAGLFGPALAQDGEEAESPPIVEVLQQEADKLGSFVESDLAGEFLAATEGLPAAPLGIMTTGAPDPASPPRLRWTRSPALSSSISGKMICSVTPRE